MRIIVNHLTRMKPGYICVAEIDVTNRRDVRPVLPFSLRTALLARYGGVLDMALELELGTTRYVGQAPEVEDYQFEPGYIRCMREVPRDHFWRLLLDGGR